jgi:hypothetical protein
MTDTALSHLRHGPYTPPACRVGDVLTCAIRGRVRIVGFSDGPIPWPLTALPGGGGFRFHVVCGDLKRGLWKETLPAVAAAWGVSQSTVSRWRRALRNATYREQLRRAYHEGGPIRALAGKKLSPEALARRREARRRTRERRQAAGEGWQPEWDTLLGTMTDAALAARRGVNRTVVSRRRWALGIAAYGHGPDAAPRRWTAAEDALLGTRPDAVIAVELGRDFRAVFRRRRKLGVAPYRRHWRRGATA